MNICESASCLVLYIAYVKGVGGGGGLPTDCVLKSLHPPHPPPPPIPAKVQVRHWRPRVVVLPFTCGSTETNSPRIYILWNFWKCWIFNPPKVDSEISCDMILYNIQIPHYINQYHIVITCICSILCNNFVNLPDLADVQMCRDPVSRTVTGLILKDTRERVALKEVHVRGEITDLAAKV